MILGELKDPKSRFIAAAILFFLVLSLILAIYLRTRNIPALGDMLFLDTDSYRFAKRARFILQEGHLPRVDLTCWRPGGVDLSVIRPLSHEYALAYFYRLVSIFRSGLSFHEVAIWYPVVIYTLFCALTFLLITQMFGPFEGLLALMFLAVCPDLIPRTAVGNVDRDSLCLLISSVSLLLYGWSFYHFKWKHGFLACCSGIMMGILGLIWRGCGIFISAVVCFNLLKWALKRWESRDTQLYVWWAVPLLLMLLGATHDYRAAISHAYSMAAVDPPLGFLVLLILQMAWTRSRTFHMAWIRWVGIGLSVFLAAGIVLMGEGIRSAISNLLENIIHPLGSSRHMAMVSELLPLSLSDWWMLELGLLLLTIFAVTYSSWKLALRLRIDPWIINGCLLIFFGSPLYLGFIVGHHLVDLTMAGSLFSGSGILLCLAVGAISFLRRRRGVNPSWLKPQEEALMLILTWLIITFALARGANRFLFFMAVPAIMLGANLIYEMYKRLSDNSSEYLFQLIALCFVWELFSIRVLRSVWIALVLTILLIGLGIRRWFLVPASWFQRTTRAAGGIIVALSVVVLLAVPVPRTGLGWTPRSLEIGENLCPIISPGWMHALSWAREHLPPNAVIAAEWQYGSQINWLSGKATLVDEDTQSEYRLHLIARHLFVGQSWRESLEFLYTLGATHLALSELDLRMISQQAFVGSDPSMDRFAPMIYLRLRFIHPTRRGYIVELVPWTQELKGRFERSVIKVLREKMRPDFEHVEVEIVRRGPLIRSINRTAKLRTGNRFVSVPIWYEGRMPLRDLSKGFVALKYKDGLWSGVFFPPSLAQSTAVKLYVLGWGGEYFEKVYPKDSSCDLLRDPVKIWKIDYPEDIRARLDYLRLDFPPGRLHRAWKQRGSL